MRILNKEPTCFKCGAPMVEYRWCAAHLAEQKEISRWRAQNSGRGCSAPGCGRKHKRYGWCEPHSSQAHRGLPIRPIKTTPLYRRVTEEGYVKLYRPEHPNAQGGGWIYEHVVVMSEYLGRPLVRGENVHHRNGDRADNRIGNLELWSTKQPSGQRVEDKVEWAREILALYGTYVPPN